MHSISHLCYTVRTVCALLSPVLNLPGHLCYLYAHMNSDPWPQHIVLSSVQNKSEQPLSDNIYTTHKQAKMTTTPLIMGKYSSQFHSSHIVFLLASTLCALLLSPLPFNCGLQCTRHQLYDQAKKTFQAKPLHTAYIVVTILAKGAS